jgi:hypothetical protein
MDDKVKAGRQAQGLAMRLAMTGKTPRGSASHFAKLSEELVSDIRKLFNSGESKARLATTYGVCWTAVNDIVKRKTWKHI